jgi:hypothetical protein
MVDGKWLGQKTNPACRGHDKPGLVKTITLYMRVHLIACRVAGNDGDGAWKQ